MQTGKGLSGSAGPQLRKNSDSHSARAVIEAVYADDRGQHSAMRRDLVPVRERDDQPHSSAIVGHTRAEKESVAGEINHLSYFFDLGITRIKGADVNGQRDFQALAAARIVLGTMCPGMTGLSRCRRFFENVQG